MTSPLQVNGENSNTYQICSNRSEPCSIRLLLMTSVQLGICDPRKGHLRHRRRQSFEVRGANVKSVSTYPLSKTENSSDLVHYFLEGSEIHI